MNLGAEELHIFGSILLGPQQNFSRGSNWGNSYPVVYKFVFRDEVALMNVTLLVLDLRLRLVGWELENLLSLGCVKFLILG